MFSKEGYKPQRGQGRGGSTYTRNQNWMLAAIDYSDGYVRFPQLH